MFDRTLDLLSTTINLYFIIEMQFIFAVALLFLIAVHNTSAFVYQGKSIGGFAARLAPLRMAAPANGEVSISISF